MNTGNFFEGANTYYDFLKISSTADNMEIEIAYSNRQLELNGLLNKGLNRKTYKTIYTFLQMAYQILSNPGSRANYDEILANAENNEQTRIV